MLSRVADSFYWMSRYLERAEHSARVVEVYLGLTLDGDSDEAGHALLVSLGALASGRVDVAARAAAASLGDGATPADRVDVRFLEVVVRSIVAARENARNIREKISGEMWEQLNRMYLLVREAEREKVWNEEPGAIVRAVIEGAHLFHGITDSTLSHDEGWHYIQIGRFIERATTTAALLEARFGTPTAKKGPGMSSGTEDYAEWVALLRACSAFEAYVRHYTADLRPERIAEFLLLNAEFPRSVRFVVDRVEDSLRAIARSLGRPSNGRPERFAGKLRAALNYSQIDEIMADNPVRYLESIRKQCDQVHTALYQTYITYSIEAAIAT
jgi:uncharacterized alpha-E superfamily protein